MVSSAKESGKRAPPPETQTKREHSRYEKQMAPSCAPHGVVAGAGVAGGRATVPFLRSVLSLASGGRTRLTHTSKSAATLPPKTETALDEGGANGSFGRYTGAQ
jgi:hypothetical protein